MVLALFTNSCYYLFIYLFAPLGFELKASHCYRKTSPLASVLTHNLQTTRAGFWGEGNKFIIHQTKRRTWNTTSQGSVIPLLGENVCLLKGVGGSAWLPEQMHVHHGCDLGSPGALAPHLWCYVSLCSGDLREKGQRAAWPNWRAKGLIRVTGFSSN
jgi:hypothetical protein